MSKREGGTSSVTTEPCVYNYYNDDQSYAGTIQSNEIIAASSDVYAGENIPNFTKRKNKGELLPFTNWSKFEAEATASGAYFLRKDSGSYGETAANWVASGNAAFGLGITEAELIALTTSFDEAIYVQAAAAAIYSSNSHDSLTFLAELHKVVGLVKNLRQTVVKLLAGKDLASAWLSGRYGWRILYFDMVEISGLIKNINEKRRNRYVQKSGNSFSGSSTSTVLGYSDANQQWDYKCTTSWDLSVRGVVAADVSIPTMSFNVDSTAWELIPYSFVVDWFVGVGTWLNAMSTIKSASSTFASGGFLVTMKREVTLENFSGKGDYSGSAYYLGKSDGKLTLRVPQSVSTIPQFNVRLDDLKIIDLIALMSK